MAFVPIRIDRTSKPPLGTPLRSDGHWSVQGLVGAWALNEGAGRVVNAAGGEIGGENTGVWGADGLSFATTSAGLIAKNIHNLPEHSIIAAIKWDGGTLNYSRIFDKGGNQVRFEVRSTSELYFSAQHSDYTSSAWRTTNLSLVSGVPCIVGASASITTQAGQLYKNGNPLTMVSHTTGNGAIINSVANPTLSRSGTNFWPGGIYWLLYFSRPLLDREMSSLSANPWQIYEPETVWIEAGGGGEIFSGSFSASIENLIQSGFGQIGCGGGMSANAGSATYSMGGLDGKQGDLSINISDLLQLLSGNSGNSANFNSQLLSLTQSLNGQHGVSAALVASIGNLSAMFGEQVVFQGTVSAVTATFVSSLSGITGNIGQALASISVASALSGITGNIGLLQGILNQISGQLIGNVGISGSAVMSIYTGAEMVGKLGVSASMASELADMRAYLVEIIIGGKIHRIVISTKTGSAVILTATGKINITTN